MAAAPANKELRQLTARLKSGYKLDQTGGGHFRILDKHGEPVLLQNGKQLIVPSTPRTGGHALKNIEAELERARVLRGTELRVPPKTREKRVDQFEQTVILRRDRRHAAATKLHDRLAAVLEPVGGIKHPQMHRDLGAIGTMLARENGEQWTPDLAGQNALRISNGGWVAPQYAKIWEQLAERLEQAKDKNDGFFALVRQARGIPERLVEVRQPAPGEWPFRVELLHIDALLVDHAYQRPQAWPFIRRESARFDPSLVGTIDVSERRRGAVFAILDGQQRTEICRMVAKTTVWASIYTGLDIASEARFFLHKNRDRKVVHPYYTFRARVTADDPQAVAIDKIVQKHGYALAIGAPTPDTKTESNIAAIAAVELAYNMRDEEGNESLSPTLAILRRATLGRMNGQNGILIRGLAQTISVYPYLDDEHMVEVIAARGPDFLLGKSREGRYGGGSSGVWMARTLRDEYNRGLTRETKLGTSEL